MRAAVFSGPGNPLTIEDIDKPVISDTEMLVKVSHCGVCGTDAHSAVLCPSFSRVELVDNPTAWDRMLNATRVRVREWWRVRDRKRMAQRQF